MYIDILVITLYHNFIVYLLKGVSEQGLARGLVQILLAYNKTVFEKFSHWNNYIYPPLEVNYISFVS